MNGPSSEGGAAAERSTRFEHQDALTRFGQCRRGGQSGDPGADDGDVELTHGWFSGP